ncbi:LOW QUALITY PROTEIN: alpha-lactalbumin-like [Podarcis muralis]
MKTLHLLSFCLLMVANETRKFEDCELFYKLRDLGLDGFRGIDERKDTMSPWFLYFASLPDVCMTGFPANYNTEYYETEEGVPHHRLFHLSSQEWCFNERRPSQNKCNISCDYLPDDDIADDVRCLKKVITEKGLILKEPRDYFQCQQNVARLRNNSFLLTQRPLSGVQRSPLCLRGIRTRCC